MLIYTLMVLALAALCFYEHRINQAKRTIHNLRLELKISDRLITDLLNEQSMFRPAAKLSLVPAPHVAFVDDDGFTLYSDGSLSKGEN